MASCSLQCIKKLIIRVIHLVGIEGCLQTRFVERCVMSHKWQTFNHWFYLLPYLTEYGCSVSICTRKPMHLRTSPMIVIRFGLYKRVETVNNLSSPYYYYPHRAYTTPFQVSCLKVNRCKILHSFFINLLVVCYILNL